MTFDRAIANVLKEEGGFTDDRKDRGNWTTGKIGFGELKGTKFGISAASYPNLDIKNLTLDQAKLIYKRDYWDKIKGDQLPEDVSFVLLDMAVNMGVSKAVKLLQKAVDTVQDGIIGNMTINAIKSDTARKLSLERILYYVSLDTFSRYGRGWTDRSLKTLLEA